MSFKDEYFSRNECIECIEVPKVFDQCLIKRCLVFGPTSTNTTSPDLRQIITGAAPGQVQAFTGCRNFNLIINTVTKENIADEPGFKRVTVNFDITFLADVTLANGAIQTLTFSVNRTETVGRLYCPDSPSQIAISRVPPQAGEPRNIDIDPEIVKLEIVAECLTGNIVTLAGGVVALDITLGYFLIIKCELIVQLLVHSYGYCPVPPPCPQVSPTEACENFSRRRPPAFHPPQRA